MASGGAGPNGSTNVNAQLERCDAPKGTLGVVEPQSQIIMSLQRCGLGSPTGVLRMLVQQSNCFQGVERGAMMNSMLQERALAQSGELQSDSNIGKGQMAVADFMLNPNVVFSESNAGGMGGALGGLIGGGAGRLLGGIAGGVKFKQAETSMVLIDARSGMQVAAATGSAEKADFSLGGALFGGGVAGGFGGYSGVKPLRQPRDGSGAVQTLLKGDEVLTLGEESNGFVKVTAPNGDGWVKAILLRKP